jgi:putative CocE/NonD family hydrolase
MRKSYTIYLLFLATSLSHGQHALNVLREDVMIPLRDDVRLGAILYRPDRQGTFPAIVYRTPYGIDDYDSYAEFPRKAAKRGYAVLLVDVRGRLRSEGEFEAYRNEKKDGFDVIEWVAGQPYCNGKVGTYGGSYPGIVQWQAMSEVPPHLMAAAPEMTPVGSHHFMYYGGAFSHPWIDWFMPYIIADKRKRAGDTSGPWDDEPATEAWVASDRKQWYNYRPLIDLPIMKQYAPEYYSWLEHPDLSPWWDFLNMEKDFPKFRNPAFLLSGWYDAAYGPDGATRALNNMQQRAATATAQKETLLILGPWHHTSLNTRKTQFGVMDFGPDAGLDYDAELLAWFDTQLKGEAPRTSLSTINIFTMGENKWHNWSTWPPAEASPRSFYFGNPDAGKTSGTLLPEQAKAAGKSSYIFDPRQPFWDKSYEKSYPYDQREVTPRSDVLVFTSAPLEQDVEVTGEIIAELFVSSTATDTDFSFTLCDVYPDGKSINLHGLDAGYIRMRYRNGFEKQELMKPLIVYKVHIGQVYTSNLFKKGHRIQVYITSSKAPHYDPNPNTGTTIATEKNLVPATNTIHFGGNTASRVILPVIGR